MRPPAAGLAVPGLACGGECLEQGAGPLPVGAVGERGGGEVGYPGVGEFGDLRRNGVLVPDDRHVAGQAAPSLSSIAR